MSFDRNNQINSDKFQSTSVKAGIYSLPFAVFAPKTDGK